MNKPLLEQAHGNSQTQQLRTLRKLRLAMQEAIQSENWLGLARLDRLCVQATESLTAMNLTRDLAVEMIRIRELYRNMVSSLNQRAANSVHAQ